MAIVKNYKGAITGFASSSLLAGASWTTFFRSMIKSAVNTPNVWNIMVLVGFLLALFSVFLVVKDRFDGGGWTKKEQQKALLCGAIILGGFFAGYYVAKYWATDATLEMVNVDAKNQGDFNTVNGITYQGGGQSLTVDMALAYQTQYVTIAAANDTDYTIFYMNMNQTNFKTNEVERTRGINTTWSQDGITKVEFIFYDADTTSYNVLLSSAVETTQFDLTDKGSTTELNITWSMADILNWKATWPFDSPNDKFEFRITINSDLVETDATTINWYWAVIATDYVFMAVCLIWLAMGLVPFIIMLDLIKLRGNNRKGNY